MPIFGVFMCKKNCGQSAHPVEELPEANRSESFNPSGATTLRLSDDETLVVESGPTTVTICNGEVHIHSKYPVTFIAEDSATFKLAEQEEPQALRRDITQPHSGACPRTQLQYAEWQSPAAEVRETSSTDGEEEIPSS